MKTTLRTLGLGLILATTIHSALATPIAHTYVSGSGSDGNACTRALPCATFTTALANTSPGGVITALDAADYGQVTIAQAVTIDGTGTQASIVTSAGQDAVVINAGSTDTVILRHLNITRFSTNSNNGITLNSGNLVVDNCKITGFNGSGLSLHGSGNTTVIDTAASGCGNGIFGNSTGFLTLRTVTLQGNHVGLYIQGGPADISHSRITQNINIGVYATQSTLSVSDCMISGNTVGAFADYGSVVRLTGNDLFNNNTGIATAGSTPGIVSTAGNNHKAGSTTPGAPTPGKIIVTQ